MIVVTGLGGRGPTGGAVARDDAPDAATTTAAARSAMGARTNMSRPPPVARTIARPRAPAISANPDRAATTSRAATGATRSAYIY